MKRRLLSLGLPAALLLLAAAIILGRPKPPPPLEIPPIPEEILTPTVHYLRDTHQYPEEGLQSALSGPENPGQLLLAADPYLADSLSLLRYLLPVMAETGCRALGFPYLLSGQESQIRQLMAAPEFQPAQARKLIWNQNPLWGYREYTAFLRGVHGFNKGQPQGKKVELVPLGPGFYPQGGPELTYQAPDAEAGASGRGSLEELDQAVKENIRRVFLTSQRRGIILVPPRALAILDDLKIPSAVHYHPVQESDSGPFPAQGLLAAALRELSPFHRLTIFSPSHLTELLRDPPPSVAGLEGDYWVLTGLLGEYQAVTPTVDSSGLPPLREHPLYPAGAAEAEMWEVPRFPGEIERRSRGYQAFLNRFR